MINKDVTLPRDNISSPMTSNAARQMLVWKILKYEQRNTTCEINEACSLEICLMRYSNYNERWGTGTSKWKVYK